MKYPVILVMWHAWFFLPETEVARRLEGRGQGVARGPWWWKRVIKIVWIFRVEFQEEHLIPGYTRGCL